jgi:hypothetical protein
LIELALVNAVVQNRQIKVPPATAGRAGNSGVVNAASTNQNPVWYGPVPEAWSSCGISMALSFLDVSM